MLTVLAEITHARHLLQADFFFPDSFIENVSAVFKNKTMEKLLCFDHVKNISAASLRSSCISMLAIWHRAVFSSGCYICKHKKCPYYIKLSLKKTVCICLEETCSAANFLGPSTLAMLHSLSFCKVTELIMQCTPQSNRVCCRTRLGRLSRIFFEVYSISSSGGWLDRW